jgi:hypothetical protein
MLFAAGPAWKVMNLVLPSKWVNRLRAAHVRESWIEMINRAGLQGAGRMISATRSKRTAGRGRRPSSRRQRSLGHRKVSISADLLPGRVPNAQWRAVLR